MCYTGFSLVAYMVLIIDFFQPPLRYFFGPGVWETAPFILLCGGLAIFGLCCLPSVEALKYSSLLGVSRSLRSKCAGGVDGTV